MELLLALTAALLHLFQQQMELHVQKIARGKSHNAGIA